MAMPAEEIEAKNFSAPGRGKRGFDAEEVNAFLIEVRDSYLEIQESYRQLLEENQRLADENADTVQLLELERNRAGRTRNAVNANASQAEAATGLLLRAQQIADEHVEEARVNAEQISSDAARSAQELLDHTQVTVDEALAGIRVEHERLSSEVSALRSDRRDIQRKLRDFYTLQLNAIPGEDASDGDLDQPVSSSKE